MSSSTQAGRGPAPGGDTGRGPRRGLPGWVWVLGAFGFAALVTVLLAPGSDWAPVGPLRDRAGDATGAGAGRAPAGPAAGAQPALEGVAASAGPAGASAGEAVRSLAETGSAPEALPRPVPLGRETRDPAAAAATAARQQADHERQLADSAAPRPGQAFTHAAVAPADIGVAFLPGTAQDPVENSRTGDPGYGTTVSTRLQGLVGLDAALAFYRKELRQKLPTARVQESRPGPGFATLSASTEQARVTVFLQTQPDGQLAVSLTRWTADGAGTGAAARASGG